MPAVLSVPPKITVAEGEAVRHALQKLVRGPVGTFYTKVLVSYGTGHRPADGPGCGPGMLYCRQVAELLNEQGVDTFSGLHVTAGTDWHVFLEKLNGRFSNCKVRVGAASRGLGFPPELLASPSRSP